VVNILTFGRVRQHLGLFIWSVRDKRASSIWSCLDLAWACIRLKWLIDLSGTSVQLGLLCPYFDHL